jgi:hypothetical protein
VESAAVGAQTERSEPVWTLIESREFAGCLARRDSASEPAKNFSHDSE